MRHARRCSTCGELSVDLASTEVELARAELAQQNLRLATRGSFAGRIETCSPAARWRAGVRHAEPTSGDASVPDARRRRARVDRAHDHARRMPETPARALPPLPDVRAPEHA